MDNGVPNARKNAEWMLAHVLERRSTDLYLSPAETPPADKIGLFDELIRRRGEREPLQYLLGSTEFMGLPFVVTPGVFIPRPDSEALVEKVEQQIGRDGPCALLDLCCGSGVIAVSLVKRLHGATAVAVDVSPEAITVAERNAALNEVASEVRVIRSEAMEYLAMSGRQFDLVVCNPPYVPRPDIPALPPEIRRHEPELSLAGGGDGLDFYRAAMPLLHGVLREDGLVAFEMGSDQGAAVADLLRRASFRNIELHPDYGGSDRFATARA